MYYSLYRIHHKRWWMVIKKEMFYLTTHSTHFIFRLYGVRHIMVKDHSDSERGNMGYSFQLTARVLLYAPSHSQDSTYHGLCYTSRGALAGTRNSSMSPPHEGSICMSTNKHNQFLPWFLVLTLLIP